MHELDTNILLWINGHHTTFLDAWMTASSRADLWIILYAAMIGWLVLEVFSQKIYRNSLSGKRWGWAIVALAVAGIALSAGLADFITSGLIKPFVCRLRPTHEPQLNQLLHIVNGYRGGTYGFPSSHAANTMAVACSFMLCAKRILLTKQIATPMKAAIRIGKILWWPIMMYYVIINCYSRIYLGVHYPSDIVVGLLFGAIISMGVYLAIFSPILCLFRKKILSLQQQ